MSRDILYHSSVQREIRDALDYYGDISERLADDFWDELTAAFDYARRFPLRHHFDPSGRRRSNLRRFPYHFLFRVSDSAVKIIVVRHNAHNPGYGSRRS